MTDVPTTATRIDVPYPSAAELRLLLRLGPSRLRLTPGEGPSWVSGTYEDPTGVLPLDVTTQGGGVTIGQRFDPASFLSLAALPKLELAVARAKLFALAIETGASETSYDAGGLPLTAFELRAGAGKYEVDFSAPNPAEMTVLDIGAGAGAFAARRLANAGFSNLRLSGGLASCTLDFSGSLRHDAYARVDAGLSGLELLVPATTAARFTVSSIAAGVSALGPFTRSGDVYATEAAAKGGSPLLTVEVSCAFGSVTLRAV